MVGLHSYKAGTDWWNKFIPTSLNIFQTNLWCSQIGSVTHQTFLHPQQTSEFFCEHCQNLPGLVCIFPATEGCQGLVHAETNLHENSHYENVEGLRTHSKATPCAVMCQALPWGPEFVLLVCSPSSPAFWHAWQNGSHHHWCHHHGNYPLRYAALPRCSEAKQRTWGIKKVLKNCT